MAGISLHLPGCDRPAPLSGLLGCQERWSLGSEAILLPLLVLFGMCCSCRKRKLQSPRKRSSFSMTFPIRTRLFYLGPRSWPISRGYWGQLSLLYPSLRSSQVSIGSLPRPLGYSLNSRRLTWVCIDRILSFLAYLSTS